MDDANPSNREQSDELAEVLRHNIHALAALRRGSDEARSWGERLADRLSAFLGSIRSVALHGLLFGAWLLVNTGMIPGLRPFDPFPFVMLAMVASIEAIFISTFVLISQNRLAELTDRRADLDVQISLLTEHEVTRLIMVCDAIATHLGVSVPQQASLEDLKKDVAPERVMQEIERIAPNEAVLEPRRHARRAR